MQTPDLRSPPTTRHDSRPLDNSVITILALLLAVIGGIQAWDITLRSMGDDFYLYWAVPRSVARWGPVENVYSERARKRISAEFVPEAMAGHGGPRFAAVANRRQDFHAYQSPFLYLLVWPLSRLDYETAYWAWQSLSLFIFAGGVIAWARILGHDWVVGLMAAALATSWFEPCHSDIRVGNSNRLILAAVALYLWIRNRSPGAFRDFAGGVVLGCTLMFKPVVLFVIPLLALWRCLDRRFGEAAREWTGIGAAGITAFVLSTLVFGNQWFHWVEAVRTEPDAIMPVADGNFAVAMLIKESLGVNSASVLTGGLGLVAVLTLVFAHRRRSGEKADVSRDTLAEEATIVAAGLLLYLLSVRLVWPHYFILTIPACMFLIGRLGGITEGKTRTAVLITVAVIWLLLSVNPLTIALGLSSAFVVGTLVAAATFVLFALMLIQLSALCVRRH